ncbi:hypothetical protein BC332_33177 [Capsicum chinense]|nr:hypothetical protein BC332_33177 [Capsicum chinense]
MCRRFFGPFHIVERIGNVAYKLDLPASSKIHHLFHVSVLHKCLGNPSQKVTSINLLDHSSSLVLQPEDVLQTRSVTHSARQISQCLIKWSGLPTSDATWEDTHIIRQKFPNLNLEDNVALHGGDIVTTQ